MRTETLAPKTVGWVLDWTSNYFESHNIIESRLDAEVLLSKLMNCSVTNLRLIKDEGVQQKKLAIFKKWILERKERKPVSYILGEREFMGMRFAVDSNTLIPRQETEILVEEAAKIAGELKAPLIADIGTGCGNIAVSLAKISDASKIFATDISIKALKVAQRNIDTHGVSLKVSVRQGDLLTPISEMKGKIDILVSNPPYISSSEIPELAPELGYEPRLALEAGPLGLDVYERLVPQSAEYLKKGGTLALELSSNRVNEVVGIANASGLKIKKVIKDYSGLERVLIAIK
jgi:release factor glutamine methyltransferase